MKRMKRYYIDLLYRWMDRLPDKITGSVQEYRRELYFIYGENADEKIIQDMKLKNLKNYSLLLVGLFVLFAAAIAGNFMNDEKLIMTDEKGAQYIARASQPSENGKITAPVTVNGEVEGKAFKREAVLSVRPQGEKKEAAMQEKEKTDTKQEMAAGRLNAAISALNKDNQGKRLYLPQKIDGIDKLIWNEKKANPFPILFFMGVGAMAAIYFSRYNDMKRLKRYSEISVEEELPDFLNKIVLLMNAGFVLSSAFQRVTEDYKSGHDKIPYFYNQISEICRKVEETNSSLALELKKFAERSRNREFMRVANVINDNLNKGTQMIHILENESNFLWFQRKKRAEEKGKIAETKLTIPLAIQLVVLIMITLTPALLEM